MFYFMIIQLFKCLKIHKPTNTNEIQLITSMDGKVKWDGLEYRISNLSIYISFDDFNNIFTYPTLDITSKTINKYCFFGIGFDGL